MTKKNKLKVMQIGMSISAFLMFSGYLFVFIMLIKMMLNQVKGI